MFGALDLSLPNVSSADPAHVAALDAQGTVLYRRLLSRDPLPEELEALRGLLDDASALDVAKLACFAVGTSVEFAFQ